MCQQTISSDNGLSPIWHQGIIWTNAPLLSIGTLGTNSSEILIIQENAFENVVWKMAAIMSRPQCVKVHVEIGVDNDGSEEYVRGWKIEWSFCACAQLMRDDVTL